MMITEEQAAALKREWESIGRNDCNPPSRQLDDLFQQVIAAATKAKVTPHD